MSQEFTIVAAIVATLLVAIGVKVWMQRILRFKMDESEIMKQLEAGPRSAEALAFATGISESRVVEACAKSSAIYPDPADCTLWRTARTASRGAA